MCAIVFDLDTEILEKTYGSPSWRNAYADIRKTLDAHGFDWRQGCTYFGGESVTPVTCFLAVEELTEQFPWFTSAVRDIRMLRIEEDNDLSPIIERASRRVGASG